MYIGSQGDMDCDSDIEGENTANWKHDQTDI
jgi:hypothetical protein